MAQAQAEQTRLTPQWKLGLNNPNLRFSLTIQRGGSSMYEVIELFGVLVPLGHTDRSNILENIYDAVLG